MNSFLKMNLFIKNAVETNDADGLNELVKRINQKIDYLSPKMHDTEDDKDYIAKLRLTHQELLKLIEGLEK